jgi:anti-anti-sigma factor
MSLTLQSRFAGDIYIIQCAGPILLGPEATALQAELEAAHARRFHNFVLSFADNTNASRMDSVGLGLIVRFAERLRHHRGDIRLAAPTPFLTNLLAVTNISKVLAAFPTEDEAILSYLHRSAPHDTPAHHGPRVLFLSPSADLASFVRTVLEQHGYDVRSASLVRDARLLLQSLGADFILTTAGPSSAQAFAALQPIAPKARALTLPPDFTSLDAHDASASLLALLKSSAGA